MFLYEHSATNTALVVEDMPRIRKLRSELLQQSGFQTRVASSLEGALKIGRNVPEIDLVVVDISLSSEPGNQDGIEVAHRLKLLCDSSVIVGYSAHYPEIMVPRLLDGIFDFQYTKGQMDIRRMASANDEWKAKVVERKRFKEDTQFRFGDARKHCEYLQEVFGQKLAALIIGLNEPRLIGIWARGEAVPADDMRRRIEETFRIVRLIRQSESVDTVLSWFVGTNPLLNGRSPALSMSENALLVELAAAELVQN